MSERTYTPRIIREGAGGITCFNIEDKLLMSREIFLTDTVDASSMDSLMKQLLYLYREDPEQIITLYINSPGGEISSGLAVYDLMRMIPSPIHTVCTGMAASMGAILFLAGDRRVMLPNSQLMIHDPAPAGGSMAGMMPDQMEAHLKELRKIQDITCGIIAERTGKNIRGIKQLTKKDTFFTAEEAVRYGLATEIMKTLDRKKIR